MARIPFLSPGRYGWPAFLLIAGGSLLHADNKPVAEPGFHLVKIGSGDKVAYIQVQDAQNPFQNVKDEAGQGNSFNSTSSFANKTFDAGADTDTKDASSYQKSIEKTFVTKSYSANDSDNADKSVPGLHSDYATSAAGDLHPAAGYDKSFLTASADADQQKTADFASNTSEYQGKKAELGGHTIDTFANPMASKTYEGPEAAAVKRDMDRLSNGLQSVKDLPDRPLTIDEVRELINHGVKPELEEKPAEPTKPLNDPSYKPEPLPPAPANPIGNDLKDDGGVPAPGTMAPPQGPPPEDSVPLPQ